VTTRSVRHALEVAAFRAARAGWMLLPERGALASGAALGLVVGSVARLRRADVDRHLAWAFPERPVAWRARVARACYAHFGREAVATLRAARGDRASSDWLRARARLVGFEALRAAATSGSGVVLLTGHLGNWELGGAILTAHGVPLDVVGKGMSNRGFERELFALRERLGMRVIEMGEASRLALRSLASGRVVAILGDQRAHGGGVLVPFFGRPAVTARGPALFALRSGAPVFVAFAVREEGYPHRYTVTVEALSIDRTGDLDRDVEALTRAYTERLQAAVEAAPEQYLWQHRRWKLTPVEEPRPNGQFTTR